MPGMDAASRYAQLRVAEALTPKVLYAVDARFTRSSPVTDAAELTSLATAAVEAGRGHVLDASHVIFPNGAITLVLVLAESHLSVHTWPEESLVAIDLFSCGKIDAGTVIDYLVAGLQLESVTVSQVPRGVSRLRRCLVAGAGGDQLDLEPVGAGQVGGIVLGAASVRVPVGEQRRPAVAGGPGVQHVHAIAVASVKGEVIEAWPPPVVDRRGHRG